MEKEGEAEGIRKVAQAINEAGNVYILNKQLEVMAQGLEKWNGVLPSVFGSSGLPMMFNMPIPE